MSINDWESIGWTEDGAGVFAKPLDREPVVDPRLNLAMEFPGRREFLSAKSVIINDYLADGQMYVTEREIILSRHGWDHLLAWVDRHLYVAEQTRRIVERVMADELAWLRGAGHDV